MQSNAVLSKTQSIRCIEPALSMQSSKSTSPPNVASFNSETRMPQGNSKIRGSSKKESSDEDSNSSGFYYRQVKEQQEEQFMTTQSSLQKKRKEDLPVRLAKLKGTMTADSDTLKASRKPLPLSCEID